MNRESQSVYELGYLDAMKGKNSAASLWGYDDGMQDEYRMGYADGTGDKQQKEIEESLKAHMRIIMDSLLRGQITPADAAHAFSQIRGQTP